MDAIELKKSHSLIQIETILISLGLDAFFTGEMTFNINTISDGRNPVPNSLCFLESLDLITQVEKVLYITTIELEGTCTIVANDPRYVFIKLLSYFESNDLVYALNPYFRNKGVHSLANIHPKAILEDDVVIEQGAIVSAGCVLKKGTVIGANSIVRENTVIGCDGISLYKAKNGEVLRFPHLAGVEIGSNVEIGANSVIAKGTLQPTKIEENVVIGNLCNIGHSVNVKSKVWMSVGTLIGGYCVVEQDSTIGLGVSVKNNLEVCKNTSIGMGSVVTKSTLENASYFGNPAQKVRGIKSGPQR